jgi:hypothetical protein
MHENQKDLPQDVLDALLRGRKIEAIKRLREARGLGLKEAKDLVEERLENLGNAAPESPQNAEKGRRKSGLKAFVIAGLVLIFIVWAMVNIPRLAGNVIVLMNRGGYDKTIFTIHDVFYVNDPESGLLWGFHGSLPDGVTVRMCAPELAPAKSLGFRGLKTRFPEGTRLEVWYNPGVTATLFQHRTLNIIPHTADLVQSEMKGIWWWLAYCLLPLLAVLIYAATRGKGKCP